MTLDKITADEVEPYKTRRLARFKNVRAKEGRKVTIKKILPATVSRELACLRAMFKHALKRHVLVKSPIGKTAAKHCTRAMSRFALGSMPNKRSI